MTLSELNLDYFFAPLVAWAEARGMKARIQAHGAPGDVMQAYGRAHIPEGENIFLGDRYQVNLRHRRLASSAAHLYGKPLASSETYTWLRTPLFVTTLEQMKPATDAVLLDGLNHVVNHGYSYSPPAGGRAGLELLRLDRGQPHEHVVAALPAPGPLRPARLRAAADGRRREPGGRLPPGRRTCSPSSARAGFTSTSRPRASSTPGLLMGLRHAGYDFDMIHDHALAELARVEAGELRAGTARYKVVIVPNARYMPPESAARLAELVHAGGHVIFVERLPEGAAGLRDREARSALVRRALEGFSPVVDRAAALARLGAVLQPDFEIVGPSGEQAEARQAAIENVGFVHRRLGACDYYFVANVSQHTQDLRVRFAASHRSPERLEPETGQVAEPLAYDYVTAGGRASTEVALHLDPFESCFVAFGTSREHPRRGARRLVVSDDPPPLVLGGPWTLALAERAPLTLDGLRSWTELPAAHGFSGWGTYEVDFEAPGLPPDVEWVIDLGTVHETAEVTLNGTPLGAAWKGLRRVACGPALRRGRNHLKVAVADLWIHDMAQRPAPDLKALEETYGVRWGRYGEVKAEAIPPAGLLGPVQLLPLRKVMVRL